jgi:hypothetical protein
MKRAFGFSLACVLVLSLLLIGGCGDDKTGLQVSALDESGPNSGLSFVDDSSVGTVSWDDPGYAQTSDNWYAEADLVEGQVSHYLKATGFAFSIPEAAIVNGIQVEVEKQTLITVKGVDRQQVGTVAAQLRAIKPPEPTRGKGFVILESISVTTYQTVQIMAVQTKWIKIECPKCAQAYPRR